MAHALILEIRILKICKFKARQTLVLFLSVFCLFLFFQSCRNTWVVEYSPCFHEAVAELCWLFHLFHYISTPIGNLCASINLSLYSNLKHICILESLLGGPEKAGSYEMFITPPLSAHHKARSSATSVVDRRKDTTVAMFYNLWIFVFFFRIYFKTWLQAINEF